MTPTVLASWNVHGWIGSDGLRDPARSFEAIRAMDADVVALQEVEGTDWEALAKAAGYAPVWGPTRPIRFGNALLVRTAIARIRKIDLSVPGYEPRGALDVVLSRAGHPLRVAATHLGLNTAERRQQAKRLAKQLERDRDLPLVLLGDLNDWTPWGSHVRALARTVGPLSRIRTFPSRRPLLALDRAAWRAPGWKARVAAVTSNGARDASDHLPLRLEIQLAGRD